MREIKQAAAVQAMLFMADGADHLSGMSGLTLSVTLSKNGGPFAAIAPVVADRGDGWYAVSLSEANTDTIGDLVVRATAPGADPGERLLSVYSLKDADTLRVAGADQTPRDLGGKLDAYGLLSKVLSVKCVANSPWFALLGQGFVEGEIRFHLASMVGGELTPTTFLGALGPEGFALNPALAEDQSIVDGCLCLDLSQAAYMNSGPLFINYIGSGGPYTETTFPLPELECGTADLFFPGVNGATYRLTSTGGLAAVQRYSVFRESTLYMTRKSTFGELFAATHKNSALGYVCIDDLAGWETLEVTTDRPLPDGVLFRVMATSLLEGGSVFIGTLSSQGWAAQPEEVSLGERMALFLGVSVEEGVILQPTALTVKGHNQLQRAKVYIPRHEGPSWSDMLFHGVTGQPVAFGSGVYTGASLAETMSTPSRKAVIIGA